MVAEILSPTVRLAHNRAGANLLSGVASTLLSARGAELGLFEVDEAALPEVIRRVRPRALALGNLFRDQLDRYGELEHVAERWRAAVGRSGSGRLGGGERRRPAGRRPRAGARAAAAVRARRPAPRLPHAPARGRLQVVPRLRDAVRVRGGLRRPPRRLPLPRLRPRAAPARRPRPRRSSSAASSASTSSSSRRRGPGRSRCRCPGSTTSTTRSPPPRRRWRSTRRSTRSWPGSSASAPPSGASSGSRSATGRSSCSWSRTRPARTRRCGRSSPEARRARPCRAQRRRSPTGATSPGSGTSTSSRCCERLDRLVVTGGRAAELALRAKYGGFDAAAIEVEPDLTRALDRALELTPPGGELVALPTYTAMLELQGIVAERGYAKPYWERAA